VVKKLASIKKLGGGGVKKLASKKKIRGGYGFWPKFKFLGIYVVNSAIGDLLSKWDNF
jgi:hypothetical protein